MITLTSLVWLTVFGSLFTLSFSRRLETMVVGVVLLTIAFGGGWPFLDVLEESTPNPDLLAMVRDVWGNPVTKMAGVVVAVLSCAVVWRRCWRGKRAQRSGA